MPSARLSDLYSEVKVEQVSTCQEGVGTRAGKGGWCRGFPTRLKCVYKIGHGPSLTIEKCVIFPRGPIDSIPGITF